MVHDSVVCPQCITVSDKGSLIKTQKGALNFSSSAFFPPITDFVEGHCTFINKGSVEIPEWFTLSYKKLTKYFLETESIIALSYSRRRN